ncbi:MAG: sugar phosphate isomerase/epimerase [Acidobacteriota bacterium]|nr:sugar phosphate isomerase/epimerase [Acidobacteriota bacterium]
MPIHRRGFLLGGAAGLAAATRDARAAKALPPNDTKNIKLSVATYSFRKFPRDAAIQMIQDLNVKYCDVKEFHLPYKDSPEQLAAGRKAFDDAGLIVVGGGNIDMKSDDESKLRAMFDYAKACRFPMMIIAPSRTNMGTIEKLVKEYNIKVAIHNHGPEDKLYPSPQSILEVIKGMDPRVGLCVDIGHTVRAGKDPVESIAEGGARVLELHVKDLTDFTNKDSQVPVGDGKMPIPAIFRQLQKMNYQGVCSLEYEVQADNPMPGMQKSFSYMRGVIAGMQG